MIEIIKKAVIHKFYDQTERLTHITGVVDTATALAKHYNENIIAAGIAAWYHDYTKYDPIEQQVRYIDLKIVKKYADMPNLYHGYSAAALLELNYQITDSDVLNAIRYHTTGRAKMSMLEKIVFIADKIEPSRNYPQVELIRELAYQDIDLAILTFIDDLIKHFKETNTKMASDQLELYQYLKEQIYERCQ